SLRWQSSRTSETSDARIKYQMTGFIAAAMRKYLPPGKNVSSRIAVDAARSRNVTAVVPPPEASAPAWAAKSSANAITNAPAKTGSSRTEVLHSEAGNRSNSTRAMVGK